jgi:hypothetical protein
MRTVTDEQRAAALVARHHLGCTAATLDQALRDVVALHSSDPLTPHLALWARLADYQPAHLDAALMSGSVWRMHTIRRTLWVVPTDRAPVFHGAATKVMANERRRLRGWASELSDTPDAWLARVESQVLDALRTHGELSTRALQGHVPDLSQKITSGSGKWTQQVPIGSRLLFLMAMDLKLFRGPSTTWRSSQYPWTLAPKTTLTDPAAARVELVRDYLARFGPVSLTDVKWWTGWTVAQTKKALAQVGALQVQMDAGPGWMLDQELPVGTGVTLLPGLDPAPMGYKERAWFLGDHGPQLFDRNGNVGPSVWVDGRVVGGWAWAGDRVRVELLEAVGPAHRAALDERAAALTEWLGGVAVTPRFRTPLEKRLQQDAS